MTAKIIPAKICNIEAIVKLLNEVTQALHRKGINQWKFPWDRSEIEPEVIKGNVYIVITGNQIIGTFSLRSADSTNFPITVNSLYLYRIAILPEYQGKKFGLEIVEYVKKRSSASKKTLYLDCWAGNEKLRRFYRNVGFEYIGDFPEENYSISVFKYE